METRNSRLSTLAALNLRAVASTRAISAAPMPETKGKARRAGTAQPPRGLSRGGGVRRGASLSPVAPLHHAGGPVGRLADPGRRRGGNYGLRDRGRGFRHRNCGPARRFTCRSSRFDRSVLTGNLRSDADCPGKSPGGSRRLEAR